MTDRFQFRWGIPEWDVGSTDIPNPIFQYYSRIPWTDKDGKTGTGISNTEAMFILHLASFRFESKKGKCCPALTSTLKERMGYKTNQGIINIMQGLEHKNLLRVYRDTGKRSVYDFKPFSEVIMKLWRADNQSTDIDSSTKIDDHQSTFVDDHQSTKVDPKKKNTRRIIEEEEISNSNLSSSSFSSEKPGNVSGEKEWDEPGSDLLEATIEKLSRTFGDFHHLQSNVQQAHNLWDNTSLGEDDFVSTVEEAAKITKEAISKSQVLQRNKRMAYFFVVLRDKLGV